MKHLSLLVFGLLAWLVAGVAGTIPATLYRGDSRDPSTIKAAGGFKSKGASHRLGPDPVATVFQHVEGTLKYPSRDPYVSTSSDLAQARKKAGKTGYVYTIDTAGITGLFTDVAAAYAAAQKRYGHADEKEFAALGTIPWSHVTSIQDGKGKAVALPTKRAAGADADVEVDVGADDDNNNNWATDWDHEENTDDLDALDGAAQDETPVLRRVAKPLRV
ncbi:uncharacterized protein SPSK_06621 [Sporothrix schenckii 1099-18]|uniref:Uncharacterized protein n=1 Tax=Sporothrix schenckii 1099-18 TaxID=1397361 RepID=A0A0F2MHU0_SPOSC|nr:uncharacterized protein SPSK_06621 [Sporothrix schenckii 1099-18]KJR89263.1 hypothetical protein SPSK_06621 [Sporothrix schenckii 1099-18]